MSGKVRWLDRRIAAPGPYLSLCLNDAQFRAALRHCKVKHAVNYLHTDHADASAHYLVNPRGEQVCIITLRDTTSRTPIEVAGLLVHEAVHVWQLYCERIGETSPGVEQEAYGIQAIAQELMAEYARQIGVAA